MTYEDEIDEDEVLDEEGRTRMKLKVGPFLFHIEYSGHQTHTTGPQP